MIQRITGVKQEREKGLSTWTGCPATMDRSHRHNDLEINLVETGLGRISGLSTSSGQFCNTPGELRCGLRAT